MKALALLCAAAFLVILDAQIVLVAIPSIGASMHFPPGAVQWVLSAYGLAFGGLLLPAGRAADLVGRRRAFMAGVALFTLSSLACGLPWSWEVLVAARVAQGVSAAIMSPAALAILMTTFAEGPARNRALGVWGSMGGLGGTAGALIGGLLTAGLGWQWIFLVNVPIGVALLALSPLVLRESRAAVRGPLVPLRIFRSRAFVGGNAVTLCAGMAAYGQGFLLSKHAQDDLGYSALQFGLVTALLPISAVVGSVLGQHLVTRAGFRAVAAASMALIGVACLLLVGGDLFPGVLVFGPGLGAGSVAASIAALSGVAERDAGLASGFQTAAFQVGGALGVALVSAVSVLRGYGPAFGMEAGFALLGVLAALVLLADTLNRTRSS
ncbi:MAG: MFS transporter [Nonomuraea sp.]|nr:MFS transporter [Nonomuraea sp.]